MITKIMLGLLFLIFTYLVFAFGYQYSQKKCEAEMVYINSGSTIESDDRTASTLRLLAE